MKLWKQAVKALRGLKVKRRTLFTTAALGVAAGAASPVIKFATPPAKLALNKAYRAWLNARQWARSAGDADLYRGGKQYRKKLWLRDSAVKGDLRAVRDEKAHARAVRVGPVKERWKQAITMKPKDRKRWQTVADKEARAERVKDLKRVRALRQLGKKSITRRSLLAPKKKGNK